MKKLIPSFISIPYVPGIIITKASISENRNIDETRVPAKTCVKAVSAIAAMDSASCPLTEPVSVLFHGIFDSDYGTDH
jgi:hypothetical protein